MNYKYITDPGLVRSHNEDSVSIIENENNEIMLIVADGMGGHTGGEIASQIAVTHLENKFKSIPTLNDKENAILFLKEAINVAIVLLYEYTKLNPNSLGMGTTVVICLYTKDYLLFGNIGDSSGYVLRNNKLHKITSDHSLVSMLVKTGKITEEEAKNHPRKNVLMKALGASDTVEMDVFDVETNVDGVFLCSDGMTNMLTDEQIAKVLCENSNIDKKLEKLVYKANNRGGLDNMAIAYLEIEVR